MPTQVVREESTLTEAPSATGTASTSAASACVFHPENVRVPSVKGFSLSVVSSPMVYSWVSDFPAPSPLPPLAIKWIVHAAPSAGAPSAEAAMGTSASAMSKTRTMAMIRVAFFCFFIFPNLSVLELFVTICNENAAF